MPSAVTLDSLDAALEAAIRRFDGASPVTAQVHHHFGYAGAAARTVTPLHMQLVLEVAAAEGVPLDGVSDVACAVELLAQYAGVHASVETGDGVWSEFGLAHGINAGDALCAIAYLQLLDGAERSPAQTVRMTRALQEANVAMCAAEAAGSGDAALVLLAIAGELGALGAGATPERARAYAQLARSYGSGSIADGDATAATAGIDAGGTLRAFLTQTLRLAA